MKHFRSLDWKLAIIILLIILTLGLTINLFRILHYLEQNPEYRLVWRFEVGDNALEALKISNFNLSKINETGYNGTSKVTYYKDFNGTEVLARYE